MMKNKIEIQNAILITAFIGGFFLVSKLLGIYENPALRFLNLLFLAYGTHRAIKMNMFQNEETRYFINFGVGLRTAALSVILSLAGLVIYAKGINPEFMIILQDSVLIGKNLNLFEILFTFALEGFGSSVIAAFVIMQFYKNYSVADLRELNA